MKRFLRIFLIMTAAMTMLTGAAYADIALEPGRRATVVYQETQTASPYVLVAAIAVAVIAVAALLYILRKRRGK